MAKDEHNQAAEHHENAAKAHRSAAEHHGKGTTPKAWNTQPAPNSILRLLTNTLSRLIRRASSKSNKRRLGGRRLIEGSAGCCKRCLATVNQFATAASGRAGRIS